MLLVALILLVAGAVMTVLAWPRITQRVAVALTALGGIAFLAVIAGLFLGSPGTGTVLALIFVVTAVIAVARPSESAAEEPSRPVRNPSRMALGALLGAMPGLMIVGVSWLLLTIGVISADQSQAAFIGLPLAVAGGVVGAAVGATWQRPGGGHGLRTDETKDSGDGAR